LSSTRRGRCAIGTRDFKRLSLGGGGEKLGKGDQKTGKGSQGREKGSRLPKNL